MNNNKFSLIIFSMVFITSIIIGIMNFNLFHLSLELTTIFIGIMIFLVAQNTKVDTKTGIILSIGIAYLYVGLLDYMHLMTYDGFGVIESSINISSQYWLSARMLEAFNILFAFIVFQSRKDTNKSALHLINFGVVVFAIATVYLKILPEFYIVGQGLTLISFVSSMVIIIILLISIWFAYKSDLIKRNKSILIAVIIAKILSEAIFTQYNYDSSLVGFSGHILKFASYAGLYYIFISGMIRDPFIQAHKLFKKKENELIELSQRDSLTKLYNHSYTFSKIEELIGEMGEKYNSLAVIMIDIDDFKIVNDTYGHLKGDEALVEFGQMLLTCDSPNKVVGRYGGDEFVVACPGITKENVINKFENLNDRTKALSKKIGANITFSAGIAFYEDGDVAKDLIYKADIKMYDSKRKGKNQFTMWEEE